MKQVYRIKNRDRNNIVDLFRYIGSYTVLFLEFAILKCFAVNEIVR